MSRIGVLLWTHGTGADRGVRKARLPCRRRRSRRFNGDDLSWHISAHIAARFAISGLGLSLGTFVRHPVFLGMTSISPFTVIGASFTDTLCNYATIGQFVVENLPTAPYASTTWPRHPWVPGPRTAISRRSPLGGVRAHLRAEPTEPRRSQASTTRAAMPSSAALPQARGSYCFLLPTSPSILRTPS